MLNDISLTVTGNITSAPELRFTPSGAAVASFRVAVTPRVKKGDQWTDGETTFLGCVAWRELAENIAESLDQGSRVIVTGALRTERWTGSDGQPREALRLQVEDIGPSLRYATAKVTKANRGTPRATVRPATEPDGDPWATEPAAAAPQEGTALQRALTNARQSAQEYGGGQPPF
jgi:single-strand DNA-binding protein